MFKIGGGGTQQEEMVIPKPAEPASSSKNPNPKGNLLRKRSRERPSQGEKGDKGSRKIAESGKDKERKGGRASSEQTIRPWDRDRKLTPTPDVRRKAPDGQTCPKCKRSTRWKGHEGYCVCEQEEKRGRKGESHSSSGNLRRQYQDSGKGRQRREVDDDLIDIRDTVGFEHKSEDPGHRRARSYEPWESKPKRGKCE